MAGARNFGRAPAFACLLHAFAIAELLRTPLRRRSQNIIRARRKGRAPKEPDPRLTSHYLRTVRRTDVMRLLVPSALRTSSVCVLNSVPMYFMGFRTVMPSATGAGSLGTAASWLIASSFLSVWWQGESVCSGWLALV